MPLRDEEPQDLSPQDRRYLESPGFESYMVAGGVFVLGLTLSIGLTVTFHREPLCWPGALLTVITAGVVLHLLKRREYRAKLREIRDNPNPPPLRDRQK